MFVGTSIYMFSPKHFGSRWHSDAWFKNFFLLMVSQMASRSVAWHLHYLRCQLAFHFLSVIWHLEHFSQLICICIHHYPGRTWIACHLVRTCVNWPQRNWSDFCFWLSTSWTIVLTQKFHQILRSFQTHQIVHLHPHLLRAIPIAQEFHVVIVVNSAVGVAFLVVGELQITVILLVGLIAIIGKWRWNSRDISRWIMIHLMLLGMFAIYLLMMQVIHHLFSWFQKIMRSHRMMKYPVQGCHCQHFTVPSWVHAFHHLTSWILNVRQLVKSVIIAILKQGYNDQSLCIVQALHGFQHCIQVANHYLSSDLSVPAALCPFMITRIYSRIQAVRVNLRHWMFHQHTPNVHALRRQLLNRKLSTSLVSNRRVIVHWCKHCGHRFVGFFFTILCFWWICSAALRGQNMSIASWTNLQQVH